MGKEIMPRTMRLLSQQEIGEKAYQKWEAAGRPLGKDLKFWLEAQRELSRGNSNRSLKIDLQPN
jgi:hypothetical protein